MELVEKLFKYFKGLKNTYVLEMAENKNDKFKDFKYFTIERKNKIYYIEKGSWKTTITVYLKLNYNEKIQANYPKEIHSLKDALIYIKLNENKCKPLHGVHVQKIHFDFIAYKKMNEKEYKNVFERLELGYREKAILEDIKTIEAIQNDGFYKVYRIHDTQNNYFDVEINRLKIVG